MYGDLEHDNDYELMRLARVSRKAAEGWRVRPYKSRESRMLSAVWADMVGLVRKAACIGELGIAPARKRLSYWDVGRT